MKKIISFILINIFFFLFGIGVVSAVTIENPLTATSFEALIDSITDFIFYVGITIAPIMIVVAAFFFLTAAGSLEKVETAKKILLYTLIGIVILLLSKVFIHTIREILGG